AKPLDDLGDSRPLLTDGDVDAHDVSPALVQDRVDRDGGLAVRAVADDELALTTADRRHRVDRLESGLKRLLDGLPLDHAGRLELERSALGGLDRPEPVQRVPERV